MPLFLCCALWNVNASCPMSLSEGVEFECLGCWPCRTAKVASSLPATLSRLSLRLQTLRAWHVFIPAISSPFCVRFFKGNFVSKHAVDRITWRRCWPQTEFLSSCGNIFQKRNDTCKAERAHLQHVLWVHGLAFTCNTVPWLRLSRKQTK